jgi:hypothetical protein
VAAGVHWDGGRSLFLSVEQKVHEALSPAYLVYLHLLNDDAAWDEVLRHPPFNERERRPKAGTGAVVAVMLVAKPRTPEEEKSCSEYATALIWAELNEVLPEHFAERVAKEGLRNCRELVREVRREARRPLRSNKKPHTQARLGVRDDPRTKAAAKKEQAEELTPPQPGPPSPPASSVLSQPKAPEETQKGHEEPTSPATTRKRESKALLV